MGSTKVLVSPSVLASDFACLADEAKRMIEAGADWLHLDVMDGHFVPNITFGPPVVKALRQHLDKRQVYFDCHLMVACPGRWVTAFRDAGVDQFTFHLEAVKSCDEAIELGKLIREHGMAAGISVCPQTPLEACLPALETGLFQTLLVMTVQPGFGGQKFMEDMIPKIAEARRLFPHLVIEVDGGINPDTAEKCRRAGANCFVAGTSLYKASNPHMTMQAIRGESQP